MVDGGAGSTGDVETRRLSPQVKHPSLLCPCIQELCTALFAQAANIGIPLRMIETLRQPDRQEHYIAIGVSWTRHSLHLPQPPRGLALAFDAAPVEYLPMKFWNPNGPDWLRVGRLSEDLGLEWGGRWKQRDLAHHQLRTCMCAKESA